jgi:hypothetical protein
MRLEFEGGKKRKEEYRVRNSFFLPSNLLFLSTVLDVRSQADEK